jgi:hypothetical protein
MGRRDRGSPQGALRADPPCRRALARASEGRRRRPRASDQHSSPSGVFGNVGQSNYGTAKAGIAAFTVIVAQELARYGVTVNCIAPNARTRMTESAFALPPEGEEAFDPLAPANNTAIVVALCTDEAQGITGQVFHIFGGAVNMLRPWSEGELFERETGWEHEGLLAELLARLPDGAAPEPLTLRLERVGGAYAPRTD